MKFEFKKKLDTKGNLWRKGIYHHRAGRLQPTPGCQRHMGGLYRRRRQNRCFPQGLSKDLHAPVPDRGAQKHLPGFFRKSISKAHMPLLRLKVKVVPHHGGQAGGGTYRLHWLIVAAEAAIQEAFGKKAIPTR